MISAYTKLHENGSPSSEAEKGWSWKTMCKSETLSVFPCQIGARNERITPRILHRDQFILEVQSLQSRDLADEWLAA
jgi:hypothetical protein